MQEEEYLQKLFHSTFGIEETVISRRIVKRHLAELLPSINDPQEAEGRGDEYGRFRYSYLKEKTDISTPFVSKAMSGILVEIRDEYQKRGHALVQKGFWPKNASFAICLTHDVDSLCNTQPAILTKLVRRGVLPCSPNKEQLINIAKKEGEAGVSSTFYFLVRKNANSVLGSDYDLTNITNEMFYLIASGHEIGLHGVEYLNSQIKKFTRDKEQLEGVLGREIYGVRQHYLKFEIPSTWQLHEKAGLLYDSTYGFNDRAGFRNGFCFPFHPYLKKGGRVLNLLEIPLNVMDVTLFDGGYMGLDNKEAGTYLDKMMEEIKGVHGLLTVLWHNSTFKYKEREDIYWGLISKAKADGAWLTNAYDIAKWWGSREKTEVRFNINNKELIVRNNSGKIIGGLVINLYGDTVPPHVALPSIPAKSEIRVRI